MSALPRQTHRARRILFTPEPGARPVVAELTPERLTFREYRRHKGSGPSLNLVDLYKLATRYSEGQLWSDADLAALKPDSQLAAVKAALLKYHQSFNIATTTAEADEAAIRLACDVNAIFPR